MSWMRRFANALVSFVDRELEIQVPGRAEEHPGPALDNHDPDPAEDQHGGADRRVPNPVEERPVPNQNITSPARIMPGGFPPSSPPDSQGKDKAKRPMSPAEAVLHPSGKKQKLQHPAPGADPGASSSTVLDSPRPGHVARAKSAPADPMRHLSAPDDGFLHSVEATPVPGRAVDPAHDTGSSSTVPNHPLPSEANTSDPEELDDLAAAILAEGMAGEIRDTDDESYFIPSDEAEEVSDDEDSSSDEAVMSSDEEDLMVPNRGQASGNSAGNAIVVLGSDDDSQSDAAENLNSDDDSHADPDGELASEDDSQADPAENLDMRMVARLNRNSFLLDTRTFCPMCRSLRHRQVPIDARRPKTQCRHSTFQLFGYHVLRQDWHQNFTPAEKIIQLGHTILHCDGICTQFVAEWNDCPHTPDGEFTEEEALAMATTMVQEQAIPSALQNLLNVVAASASNAKNRGDGYQFIDYDDEYMVD